MDRSRRVFGQLRSFDEVFPTIEDADVEYTETGSFPVNKPPRARPILNREFKPEPRRRFHSVKHGGLLPCSNPSCRRRGYEIDLVLSEMRHAGETVKEGSLSCPGDEGSPKGKRIGNECPNSVRYKLTVKYKT
jgi:hypothetical protein